MHTHEELFNQSGQTCSNNRDLAHTRLPALGDRVHIYELVSFPPARLPLVEPWLMDVFARLELVLCFPALSTVNTFRALGIVSFPAVGIQKTFGTKFSILVLLRRLSLENLSNSATKEELSNTSILTWLSSVNVQVTR